MIAQSPHIALIISRFAQNTGWGGHYFSAKALAVSLADNGYKITFIVVGSTLPQALDDIRGELLFVKTKSGPQGQTAMEAALTALSHRPDTVIAFDQPSGMLARRYCRQTKTGLVLVKAGGPWPKRYFSKNSVQVHFNLKDHQHALVRNEGSERQSFWIPNRVAALPRQTPDASQLLQSLMIDPDELVIIRIGRVTEVYRAAFEATLKMRRVLGEAGIRARAILIGFPQSASLVADLGNLLESGRDHLLTGPEFTRNASRFLPAADINVGVGRGFMEGCSLGQFMFAIANNSGLPVRCNSGNIMTFLSENISMRVMLDVPQDQRKAEIINVAQTILAGKTQDPQARDWFENWFSAKKIPEKYGEAIAAADVLPERLTLDYLYSQLWLYLAPIEEMVRKVRSGRHPS